MLPSEIFDHARYLSKTSNTDGTGGLADLVRIFNDYYVRQCRAFALTNQNKFGRKAKTTLTSATEAFRLPPDCMQVKRIEITYDGSTWQKAVVEDSSKIQDMALDVTSINQWYQRTSPRVDVFGDTIYVRPLASTSVSLGLRLWYVQMPTLLATSYFSSLSFIITPPDYHGYLAYGIASEIGERQGNEAFIARMIAKWENSLEKIKAEYAPQVLDQPVDFFPDTNEYG